ncbi:hypothetical protein N2152v2_004051 [Parachlorella kessleri]
MPQQLLRRSWLERPSKKVESVLQREAQYFRSWMRGTGRTQQELLESMLRLLPEEQVTPPERVGPYLYYVRQLPDRPHPCYMRRPAAGGGVEEVLLDVNELARVHGDAISVGQVKLSRCHQRLAFTLEPGDGSERFVGFTRDLSARAGPGSGQPQEHPALDGVVSLEWAGDGTTLLYTTPDGLGRPSRVLRCDAWDPSDSQGQVLFEEQDECFFVELTRTKDWAYLAINSNSKTSSEVHLLPADPPAAPLRLVCRRREGLEYFVEHHKSRLLLLSNAQGAGNYALFSVPADPEGGTAVPQEAWQLLVPEREGVALEDMDVFQGAVVLYERREGRPAVAVLPTEAGLEAGAANLLQVPLPDWAFSVTPGANADFQSSLLRLSLSSPIHPQAVYDYHLPPSAPHLELVQPPAVHAHDPGQYSCTTRWACSADGTAVPMTVVHGKGVKPGDGSPCLVVVYGAYGHCLPNDFYPERISLLQRGWVLALAHVRGGGELGRRWHAAGRAANKQRSVEDLEACIDALVEAGLAQPGRLALEALSAGGLTAGALLNRRPGSVSAALLEAPFVDVLTAMCDPGLPLTMHEYEEWGDPRDPQVFEQLRQLCPYQNIHPSAYPATLVTCSQSDFRVPFWGPVKYAARLRAAQQGAGPVLLLPDAHEGHFAHESDRLKLNAMHYAFLLKALGCIG